MLPTSDVAFNILSQLHRERCFGAADRVIEIANIKAQLAQLRPSDHGFSLFIIFLRNAQPRWRNQQHDLSVAYFSVDKGLIEFGTHLEFMLIIDPINGTRPAMPGFESCVMSVALADYTANVKMVDGRFDCIEEICGPNVFFAERRRGISWLQCSDVL